MILTYLERLVGLDGLFWAPHRWLLIVGFSILQLCPFALVYFLVELLKTSAAEGSEGESWPFLCLLALALGELLLLVLCHCPCHDRNEELLRSNKRALYSYRVRFAKQFTMSGRDSRRSSPKHERAKSVKSFKSDARSEPPDVLTAQRSERVVHINSLASIFTSSNSKETSCVETRVWVSQNLGHFVPCVIPIYILPYSMYMPHSLC